MPEKEVNQGDKKKRCTETLPMWGKTNAFCPEASCAEEKKKRGKEHDIGCIAAESTKASRSRKEKGGRT